MSTRPPQVLVVVGSLQRPSSTRAVLESLTKQLRTLGCEVDFLDLLEVPLPLFNPSTAYAEPSYLELRERVEQADVFVLGTPDYHGCMSGALKNFLDHFWHEFAGKLFASVVASSDKGLTVSDQIRTVARQCYAWSIPYAVAFSEKTDVQEGQIVGDVFRERLRMLGHDLCTYGGVLAAQRRLDLAGTDPGFLARYRSP